MTSPRMSAHFTMPNSSDICKSESSNAGEGRSVTRPAYTRDALHTPPTEVSASRMVRLIWGLIWRYVFAATRPYMPAPMMMTLHLSGEGRGDARDIARMKKENDGDPPKDAALVLYPHMDESSGTRLYYLSQFVIKPEHIGKASRSKVQSRLVPLSNRGTG